MWVKVDDQFPDHDKVLDAGERLEAAQPKACESGATGSGRVIATWQTATCYSNSKLTDGFISNAVARAFKCDHDPIAVFEAMQNGANGLVRKVRGGWQLLNYHEYQPSKAKVKKERKKARERMRKARAARAKSVRANKPRRSREHLRTVPVPFANPDPARPGPYVDQNRRSTAAGAPAHPPSEVKAL